MPNPPSPTKQDRAIAWQEDFTRSRGRPPKWKELEAAGFDTGLMYGKRFRVARQSLNAQYGTNRGTKGGAEKERDAIAWQANFGERHKRVPTLEEFRDAGWCPNHFNRWPRFTVERRALTAKYGRNTGHLYHQGMEARAIRWQAKFAEESGRLPTYPELRFAGFGPRIGKNFRAQRKTLLRSCEQNHGGLQPRREQETIAWMRDFAKENLSVPTWVQMRAAGFRPRGSRDWKQFHAARTMLVARYGENHRGYPSQRRSEAETWLRDFADSHSRLPTWEESEAAGFPRGAVKKWDGFMRLRRSLERRYGRNHAVLVKLEGGQTRYLPLPSQASRTVPVPPEGNGHAIAEAPAPPAAGNGHAIAEAPAPPTIAGPAVGSLVISHREQWILQALLEMSASTAATRRTGSEIAHKAEHSCDPSLFKRSFRHLKSLGFIEVKEGRGGGLWLSEAGRAAAAQMSKS